MMTKALPIPVVTSFYYLLLRAIGPYLSLLYSTEFRPCPLAWPNKVDDKILRFYEKFCQKPKEFLKKSCLVIFS